MMYSQLKSGIRYHISTLLEYFFVVTGVNSSTQMVKDVHAFIQEKLLQIQVRRVLEHVLGVIPSFKGLLRSFMID